MAWQDEIYDAFVEAKIRQVAFVPDAGHKEVIRRCIETQSMRAVSMTTEEDGIALLAGAWLGGDGGGRRMKSSGGGNRTGERREGEGGVRKGTAGGSPVHDKKNRK